MGQSRWPSSNAVRAGSAQVKTAHANLRGGDGWRSEIAVVELEQGIAQVLGNPAVSVRSTLAAVYARLDEAIERRVRGAGEISVLCVDLSASPASQRVAEILAQVPSPPELIAWDRHGEILVGIVREHEAAQGWARRLEDSLSVVTSGARMGRASHPEDGWDAATLAETARRRVREGGLDVAAQVVAPVDIRAVFHDPAMQRLHALLERLAPSDLPLLIAGETGSGKEVVANTIHALSHRSAGPMIVLNCAAIPDGLLESELFGHERGAFSGAHQSKPGFLEEADRGTLFLDEVGDLSLGAQAKLLRVLETKRVCRLGSRRESSVDVRVIAATNRSLSAAASKGTFRADLLYRLRGAPVAVPPLRSRPLDIPVLARLFLTQARLRSGQSHVVLAPSALRALGVHCWPGNVRELKNAMEYVAATASGSFVDAGGLLRVLNREPSFRPSSPSLRVGASSSAVPPSTGELHFRPIAQEIEELERTRMKEALACSDGVRVRAAALIGMPLRTFVTKMKTYGITEAVRARRGTPQK